MYYFLKNILIKPTNKTSLQFLRYTIIGGIAFVVDISLLYIFTEYLHFHYLFSALISFLCGLLVNFSLSRKVIFTEKYNRKISSEFLMVGFVALIGLGLNEILIWSTTEHLGVYYLYSKIFAAVIVYLWNFFARKLYIYRTPNNL